ncbi:retrovirus-related pol polyprotein from transposon TNT 1-94 [Tanacetum coccineum]
MLNSAKLPKQFWGEAINTACYTQNRSIIVKRHGKTTYDVFRGRFPYISYSHVFGFPVHIHNHKDHLIKFDEKADDEFFLSYSPMAKAFKDDEAISQSSTKGDAINFNENISFPDDEFLEPRSKVTQCLGNIEYFPYYIPAYENTTPSNSPILQDSVSSKEPIEFTITDDHLAPNELDQPKLVIWSREKHIELVNIIGEPLAGIITRSRVRDSKAQLMNVSYMGFMVYQMDVKGAFLNAKISEEVYVNNILGFKAVNFPIMFLADLISNSPHVFVLDYVRCNQDRKSTSRGCQILGGKLVCWSAKKQSSVAMSLAEAKYVAPAGCCAQVLWIKSQLADYDIVMGIDLLRVHIVERGGPGSDVALLEHPNVLNHPMLSFLSNCCISTALTRQPSATYIEYLEEFWYTAEVDEATEPITFSLSLVKKPLSFTQEEFISTTGLPVCENVVPTPPKETVRSGLATLGLFDKEKPSLSSFVFVNSSPPKIKKKHREANICYTRYLTLIFEELLGENYINDDLTFVKSYTILVASFQTPLASKVCFTSYMLKVDKLFEEPEQSLILSSEKVNADDGADKSLVISPKKQVAKTQHAKEPVAIADATKSLGASESAKEQVNQPKAAEAEKIIDEIDQKYKAAQETPKIPYDTESEINIIKKFQPRQLDDDAQIMFIGAEPSHFEYDQSKSIMHGASDSDSGLCLMHDDDLASLTGFETPDSADDDSKEGIAETFYASTNMPAQPDPLGPLHEELCILNTKIDKKNFPSLLLEALKNTLPQLIKDSIKQSVSESIKEKLPVCAAHVQQSLQNQLLKILLNPMNKEFNALNTLESRRFVMLQKELSKVIRTKIGKLVKAKVRKGMSFVSDRLASVQSFIATNSQHVSDLRQAFQDMNFLLESAEVFKKANEGEK